MTIIAATGHRPDKLGGYEVYNKTLRHLGKLAWRELQRLEASKVICGMAPGWDQAVGLAAVTLGIPMIAAIPFEGQEKVWGETSLSRTIFDILKQAAAEVVIVSPGRYEPYKMQVRNRWMIDRGEIILALHDGTRGGTFNAVQYALERSKPITNAWPLWKAIQVHS